MTWVKICGITNVEDALTAVEAGADALGFVFYEKSPRNVMQDVVREIVRQLPATIEKVGVFVQRPLDEMERVAAATCLTGVQVHLKFPHTQCSALQSKTLKYFVLRANELLQDQACLDWYRDVSQSVGAIFLDAGSDAKPGGTGKPFDWRGSAPLARALQQNFRVVVAGGLTPTNVPEAMRILKPWGVDVSTGVESRPGKKDRDKLRAFMAAVRGEDKSL
ncbi:MAG: phosphoribosylanthranilate isomerase [Terriglobales bacterium]